MLTKFESALALSADELLKLKNTESLFFPDSETSKKLYRALSMRWHPDRDGGRDDVFQQIKFLYEQVEAKITAGTWTVPGEVTFICVDGTTIVAKHLTHRTFELGEIYVGETYVAYAITKDNEDLYENGVRQIKSFKFANDKMKAEMDRFLPKISRELETATHRVVFFFKNPDLLLLSDVIDHFKGRMPERHAAWVISRLYNIACYLKYSKIIHPSIQPDSIFISPQQHDACLYGGWWYSAKEGNKLVAAPGRTVDLLPSDLLRKPIADPRVNSELVRSVGREMLGDVYGSKLLVDKALPKPLVLWLKKPGGDDAYQEYATWLNKVVIDSFGPRKFIKWDLTAQELYKD